IFGSNKLREKEIAQADRRSTTSPPRSRVVEAEAEDAQNPIGSYAIVQRFINDGLLPPKDSVRIEEMINYFTYNYPRPKPDELFSIDVEVAGCPWADSHRLFWRQQAVIDEPLNDGVGADRILSVFSLGFDYSRSRWTRSTSSVRLSNFFLSKFVNSKNRQPNHRENREHSRNRERSRSCPEPGIIPDVAQIR